MDEIFPDEIVESRNEQEMFIRFNCGSTFQLIGSDRFDKTVGSGPAGIVYSEWALANPSAWAYHRPMLEENGGWALFISTPRGRNHAKDMFDMARANPKWFAEISTIHDTRALTQEQLDESLAEYVSLYGEDEGRAFFSQEYECFKPDALVACHDRVRPIAEIVAGDAVLTHTGRIRRVNETIVRDYDGEMVVIEAYGSRPIECTPEHPILTCDPSSQTYHWKCAKDIVVGDWLVTPRLKTTTPVISEALAKIIAWYVCEGNVSGNAVTFAIGAHEPDYVKDLEEVLSASGFSSKTVLTGDNVSSVSVASVELADFLVSQCGSLSHNKRIPMGLIRGREAVVWDTLFKGDGCIHKPKGSGRWALRYSYTTVSEGLAQQVQILGASLGFTGSYTERVNGNVIQGRTCSTRTAYAVQMTAHSGHDITNGKTRMAKNGALGAVRSVKRVEYSGPVYNLSVQGDESYVVNSRSVHNCSFNAALLGAYYAREMLAVRNEGRIAEVEALPGVPVHTAWDIGVRDDTSIWWWQVQGAQLVLLDCHSENHGHLETFAELDYAKRQEHGWARTRDAKHGEQTAIDWVPHDASVREWGTTGGRSRLETMQLLGLNPRLCPNLRKLDGINAVRRTLPRAVFHPRCETYGIAALEQYCRDWDEDKKVFRNDDNHSWASHAADAMRYLALAWQQAPGKAEPVKPRALPGQVFLPGAPQPRSGRRIAV